MPQPAAPTLDRRPRPQRLRATADFERVMRRGRRVRGSLLHLVHRSNGIDESRIGYSVGRRVGNAVVRNRVKRRLRELVAARHLDGPFGKPWKINTYGDPLMLCPPPSLYQVERSEGPPGEGESPNELAKTLLRDSAGDETGAEPAGRSRCGHE